MLVGDLPRIDYELLKVDGCLMPFFLAGEGIKVSMHSFGTLFVLMV